MSKPRKLSIEEYKIEEEKWLTRNGEYYNKLIALNVEEHAIIKEQYNDDFDAYEKNDSRCEEFENKRKALKEEYKGYVCEYFDPDFYCVLKTSEDIDKAVHYKNTRKWMKESIKDIGKVMVYGNDRVGIYDGIACCVDDLYYILRDKTTKKTTWSTCVGHIEEYVKPKSYTMVTNGKDYL